MRHDRIAESENIDTRTLVEQVRDFARPCARTDDLDPLLERIGDARFTDMADDGEFNIGQLVRERHGDEGVVLVGFGSYRGTVIAGQEWDAPLEVMTVPPGRPGSWEDVLHRAGTITKLLLFAEAQETRELMAWRGHLAIGVVYHPEYERYGNYVPTLLPRRYDAFLFIDETKALHPLHMVSVDEKEVPETYPSGV
jgi:erythromycin esterase-like protein